MNRKVMAVAVAAAFAAPAAFAQSTVTIGGTINITWDNVRANGATLQGVAGAPDSNNIKSHDRVRDGAGSNIRFFVGEDLGGGNQAFVQVESAIIQNSDTRATNFGTLQGIGTSGNSTAIWGNRNTAIGIRSKSLGRFLIGVWDMHYDEMGAIDPMPSSANSSNSYLGLMTNLGSALSVSPGAGARYANVLRWDSPVWSGFNMTVSYARPTDGVPVNQNAGGGATILDGKKNRAWQFAARYDTGGLALRYSYLNDKDAGTAVTLTFGGGATSGIGANSVSTVAGGATGVATSVWKVTSNRLGARYRFANGFGLGLIWDNTKFSADHERTGTALAVAGTSIKRTAWAIPLTFETGNHVFAGTYARAKDWRGTLNGVSVSNWGYLSTADTFGTNLAGAVNAAGLSNTLSGDTGAKLWTLSYQYKLSQRTSVHASWTSLKNEALARYDFFANSSGAGAAAVGADPRSIALGMRHTF